MQPIFSINITTNVWCCPHVHLWKAVTHTKESAAGRRQSGSLYQPKTLNNQSHTWYLVSITDWSKPRHGFTSHICKDHFSAILIDETTSVDVLIWLLRGSIGHVGLTWKTSKAGFSWVNCALDVFLVSCSGSNPWQDCHATSHWNLPTRIQHEGSITVEWLIFFFTHKTLDIAYKKKRDAWLINSTQTPVLPVSWSSTSTITNKTAWAGNMWRQ